MKRIVQSGLIVFLAFQSSAYALDPVQGWYAGLLLGITYAPTATFTVTDPLFGTTQTGSLSNDILGNVGGQVGYRCNQFRLEGEFLFNNNSYNKLTIGDVVISSPSSSSGIRLDGDTNTFAGMFNGYFDLYTPNEDNYSRTVPYVGAGIGYAYVQHSIQFYLNDEEQSKYTRTDRGAAAQAIVGISYFMDDFTTIGLDGRYFTTVNHNVNGPLGFNTFSAREQFWAINLVFNGAFDFG